MGARRAWALVLSVTACAFDSSGMGGPAPTSIADASGSMGGTGTTGDDGATSDPPPQTSGDTEVIDGAAMLVLVDAPVFDFLDVPLGALQSNGMVLRNEGSGPAMNLAAAVEGTAFGFSGGTYPGLGGTCTDTLAAADSCVIVIACAPPRWGEFAGAMTLHYDDPVAGAGALELSLRARGVGESDNLLENGDAEQAGTPPEHWADYDDGGDDWRTVTDFAFGGARSITAGWGPGIGIFRLRQSIEVDQWAEWIDGEGLSFRLRAQTRASSQGDDPHEVRLRFLDDNFELSSEFPSPEYAGSQWQAVDLTAPAPAGTRRVQVQLRCYRTTGMNCNAYFDDVSLVASYP